MAKRRRKAPEKLKTVLEKVAQAQASFDRWYARLKRAVTMMEKAKRKLARLTNAPRPRKKIEGKKVEGNDA